MGDMGDTFRELKDERKRLREEHGVSCPQCNVKQPKRIPTTLLPGQRCKVCGYVDPRPRLPCS